MKSVANYNPVFEWEKAIETLKKAKSDIDVIRQEKGLEDGHELSLASGNIRSFLSSFEKSKTE